MNQQPATRPRRSVRWIKALALLIAATLLLSGAALWFLAATETGLRILTGFATSLAGERLSFAAAEGRLAGPLHIEDLQLDYGGGQIAIGQLDFDWSPLRLFSRELRIEYLDLIDTSIRQTASAEPPATEPSAPLDLRLPFAISVGRASVQNLRFANPESQYVVERILLVADARHGRLQVETLELDAEGLRASAAGDIGLDTAADSQLSLRWELEPQQQDALAGTGTLQLEGKLDAYRFELEASLRGAQLPAAHWQSNGVGTLEGLTVSRLRGELLDGRVSGHGKLDWQPQLRWDVTLALDQIDPGRQWPEWPGKLSAQLSSEGSYSDGQMQLEAHLAQLNGQLRDHAISGQLDASLQGEQVQLTSGWQLDPQQEGGIASTGQLQIDGSTEDYRFQLRTAVQGAQLPAGDWRATGQGNMQGLVIDELRGELLEGTVAARAQLDWQPQLQWDVTLTAQQLNPGQHWEAWPGTLSAQLASKGRYVDGAPHLNAQLTQLEGRLRDYPVSGEADVAVEGTLFSLRTLQLQSGDNRLTASGEIGERLNLQASLRAEDLSEVAPGLNGSAEVTATALGSRQQPDIEAQIAMRDIEAGNISLRSLQGDVDLHWAQTANQSIQVQATDIRLSDYHLADTKLSVSGPLAQHTIALTTRTGEHTGELRLSGGWQDAQWRGSLEKAQWDIPQTGAWTLAQPVPLLLAGNDIQVPETCWNRTQTEARLCIDFRGDPAGQWQADTQLRELPLTMLDDALGTRLQWSSPLDATLSAKGVEGRLATARLAVEVGSGSLQIGDAADGHAEQIQGMDMNAALDSQGVEATLDLALIGDDHVTGKLTLPGYQPLVTPWQQQPLALSLAGRLDELGGLGYLLEDIATFKGSIAIDVAARGTLGKPVVSGDIGVEDGIVGVNQLGIELRELQLAVHSAPNGVSVRGSCVSGEGRLSVAGDVAFEDVTGWSVDVNIKGKDFEAVHIPEALVLISPDLSARIRPPAIDLQGQLHVPRARLKPKQLPEGVTVSRDVVIIDRRQQSVAEEAPWKITSQVQVSLGEQVTLDGFGVKGRLGGDIRLIDEPGRVTRASGALTIEKGTYTVYGRELDIVRGQLLFGGGPVDNPGLDFAAERVVSDVHAGVTVRGTLKEPDVALYSDPAMSDADILSYITLGRPAAEAGQSGGGAADALALASGGYLAGSVGESLGLDELKLESGGGTLEEASLVLGTYLSPELYVRYSAGLNAAASRFEALYELSDHWSIRAQTSQNQSAADVIFSFER